MKILIILMSIFSMLMGIGSLIVLFNYKKYKEVMNEFVNDLRTYSAKKFINMVTISIAMLAYNIFYITLALTFIKNRYFLYVSVVYIVISLNEVIRLFVHRYSSYKVDKNFPFKWIITILFALFNMMYIVFVVKSVI